jgi:hypothetical protein
MEVVKDGEFVDTHALVMSYPYSNAGFAVPLPSENQECFLERGLKTFILSNQEEFLEKFELII